MSRHGGYNEQSLLASKVLFLLSNRKLAHRCIQQKKATDASLLLVKNR